MARSESRRLARAPQRPCALFDEAAGALIRDEAELIAACHELSGREGVALSKVRTDRLRRRIRAGEDPLGDAFVRLRTADERRAAGAVYTPLPIARAMLEWLVRRSPRPSRIIDPGAGSGRFTLGAAAMFPEATLVAIESDPLAASVLRANLAARGWGGRASVREDDYREVALGPEQGVTAFIGNPPYVRHHGIDPRWKRWYVDRCAALGVRASALAGLHLHFFVQTLLLAREGDVGIFITPAEWLDVNYGSALRELLATKLGAVALHVLEPQAEAFPGTATTAAITCFRVGEASPTVRLQSVKSVQQLALDRGTALPRRALRSAPRWSILVRPSRPDGAAANGIELGELLRVHRGQVTGANQVWIDGPHAGGVPPRFKLPSVTKARELILAGERLRSGHELRRVIDLPEQLDELAHDERPGVDTFLRWARGRGADSGYIARHRKAWWSVRLRAPAPILCTYMARRPPQFTLNACGARHINVAHGLYPREPLSEETLAALVAWLNAHVGQHQGRTYAGGLTKFEPGEIERLRVPPIEALGR